jgi:hypothetical protein
MAHKRAAVAGFLTLGANKSPLASITHGVDQFDSAIKKTRLRAPENHFSANSAFSAVKRFSPLPHPKTP